jgi:transcriptional regulator with XRE-family HTH domain
MSYTSIITNTLGRGGTVGDEKRRKALGDFLRTRRAQVSPTSVGLPKGTRRRTPGLRREEVAQLAGVSVTWYTWLEQGRDITVSEQVLQSIAATLELSPSERKHLFRLARKQVPVGQLSAREKVWPALQTVVDHLRTSPAWVIDYRWNILVWNQATCEVFGDFGAMPPEERNILRFVFTNESLHQRLADPEAFVRSMLATFRATCSRYIGEPWFVQLVEDLKVRSPEFQKWWPRHDVRETPLQHIKLDHPKAGLLELDNISFEVMNNPEVRMCVYAATLGSETADKIEHLVNSVGGGLMDVSYSGFHGH